MNPNEFPTKGNLIAARNSLALARQGYDLMDRKRNILVRELMDLIDRASDLQSKILDTYRAAYAALQTASIQLGMETVEECARSVPLETSVQIKTRSIMGVEIPLVEYNRRDLLLSYGFNGTSSALDEARQRFVDVKYLTLELAMTETAAYRLAANIRRTQKRSNALKNVTIPQYEELVRTIAEALEEKDREEFTRLKVIKRRSEEAAG